MQRTRNKYRKTQTISSSDVFRAEVQDLVSDGRGLIRHPSGKVLFVPGVWKGELGEFKALGAKEAQLVELLEASPARIEPPCPHYGSDQHSCGACPWQFVDYSAQLEAKFDRLVYAMQRLPVNLNCIQPVLAAEKTWAYRNRAQLKSDGRRLGYVAARTNQLVDVKSCGVLNEANAKTFQALRDKLPEKAWQVQKKRPWTTLNIDDSIAVTEVSLNRRLAFRQGNSDQNLRMKQWLREQLSSLNNKGPLLELFCGSGNFTELIAELGFSHIIAAEASAEAIARLTEKNIPTLKALEIDLFNLDRFTELLVSAQEVETLVLDPPREGLKIREPIFKNLTQLQQVFYISCDLATFQRDLADFLKAGFSLELLQPIDLFPQTPHIELMAVLRRN